MRNENQKRNGMKTKESTMDKVEIKTTIQKSNDVCDVNCFI